MFGLSSWEAGGRFTEIPNRVFYFGELGRQWIDPSFEHVNLKCLQQMF